MPVGLPPSCGWLTIPMTVYLTWSMVTVEPAFRLREYAHDWQDHLLNAANHRENWGLVQLISLSDDEQLREWLVGSAH
jgi:hypothetical protein